MQTVDALRCFAGNPAYRHECSSLSYCLTIFSKIDDHTQWSCDGNSFNQVSLCSNLGILSPDSVSSRSSAPVAVFDQPSGAIGGQPHHRLPVSGTDDDALAEYYRAQEANAMARGLSSMEKERHQRRLHYAPDGSESFRPQSIPLHRRQYGPSSETSEYTRNNNRGQAYRGNAGGVVRYYAGQSKCFDGGDLGRICCCSTDFCNGGASLLRPSFCTIVLFIFALLII
ncbi:hypothetical protein Ddc_11298 [Ditylenchus destructor]|nr:hypothetical protein Ddc_11298 [Ditylenchus destructor]